MPSASISIHLDSESKVNTIMRYDLIPGRHSINIEIGKLNITVFGTSKELCGFRDAIASGISPPIKEETDWHTEI